FWNSWLLGMEGLLQGLWPFQWVQHWTGVEGFAEILAVLFLVLLFIPMCFVVAVIFTSIFVMPIALKWVVEADFPGLEKKRGGSVLGSLWNTLKATVVFVVGFIVTLPLWLLPGCQVVVPLLLASWLNRQIFMYDVLQDYASKEERSVIQREEGPSLLAMGMFLGFLSYIPLAIFFIPVLAALCYTYYGLNELNQRRGVSSPEE
ncbi:MAG: EI24 domain-containing protein, partial [Bacillota bacterium]